MALKAHAHEFIEQLPEGYKRFLSEQSVRLSRGKKQGLARAGAILKDFETLLFDEATSALDAEREDQAQAVLKGLMIDRIAIIIAHPLATVVHADIVVMDQGRVVNVGNHKVLLNRFTV